MPFRNPKCSTLSLKRYKLIFLFLCCPLFFFGQTLTGLWTGSFSFDSTTVRKDQSFEIALTEYKGKVYGYSRSEFIVNDTLYYIVKRVKGTIEGDICEVTDDDIVAYNFRGKLDKGVKVTSTFRRNQNDSAWYLDGNWKTNATKKYLTVSGKVSLAEEKDLTASKIFPHLEELKLTKDIAFYQERKEGIPIVKLVKPEKLSGASSNKTSGISLNSNVVVTTSAPKLDRAEPIVPEEEIVAVKKAETDISKTKTNSVGSSSVDITPTAPNKSLAENKTPEWDPVIVKKPEGELVRTDTKPIPSSVVDIKPGSQEKMIAKNKPPVSTPQKTNPSSPVTDNKQLKSEHVAKVENKQSQAPPKNNPATNTVAKTNTPANNTSKSTLDPKKDVTATDPAKQNPIAAVNPTQQKDNRSETIAPTPIKPKEERPLIDITAIAALVEGRKSEFSQVVSFSSDSLELSLYDNGEIDGDTVSIYMDGQVILSRQGLKASAIKKTIHITPGHEDFTLVLFAENLGKYPPNTGLLVVHDGEDVYNLRFSSDFQKNAGIVFRRKK